jgi:dihydrofolate reductase
VNGLANGADRYPLAIVVALAENGVIGGDNKLIWRLKTDLRRFRELTIGKPVIMGRKTFASIGRPLPGRANVVLSRDPAFAAAGATVVRSWPEALAEGSRSAEAMGADEVCVIGGAAVFALALPMAARLHLTCVHAAPEGDVVFPDYDRSAFREIRREEHPRGPDDEFAFTFIDLERRRERPSR